MKRKNDAADWAGEIGQDLKEALSVIHDFISRVTGRAPSQKEMASALKRYFVLNEIKEHIEMERIEKSD